MKKLVFALLGLSLSFAATAGGRLVDTETFFGKRSGEAIRKCEKAQRRDYRCESSQYRCTPCTRKYQASHSSYDVLKKSSYGNDYDTDYDTDYGKVEKRCVVVELDRKRVVDRYSKSAVGRTATRAKEKACDKAMRACRDHKGYGNRCVEKSRVKSNYNDFDAALDIIGGVLELID